MITLEISPSHAGVHRLLLPLQIRWPLQPRLRGEQDGESESDGCTNCTQLADGSCVKRAAALSNMKDYHQLSKDERKLMMARLRLWAKVVHGKAMNYTCQNASVPRPLRQMGRRGYGTRDADSWHVCYDGWRPWVDGCTGVSIGIGGEWSFEDGLAQRIGCRLWAYDPTEQLAASHSKHAEMVSTHYGGRMKFDLISLGGEVVRSSTRTAGGTANSIRARTTSRRSARSSRLCRRSSTSSRLTAKGANGRPSPRLRTASRGYSRACG